jgi:hypothetical protein
LLAGSRVTIARPSQEGCCTCPYQEPTSLRSFAHMLPRQNLARRPPDGPAVPALPRRRGEIDATVCASFLARSQSPIAPALSSAVCASSLRDHSNAWPVVLHCSVPGLGSCHVRSAFLRFGTLAILTGACSLDLAEGWSFPTPRPPQSQASITALTFSNRPSGPETSSAPTWPT